MPFTLKPEILLKDRTGAWYAAHPSWTKGRQSAPQPWTVAVPVPSDRKAFNTTLFAIYPTRTQTPLPRQGGGWVNRTQRRAVEQPSSANQAPRSGVQDMGVDTIEHHEAETGIMS